MENWQQEILAYFDHRYTNGPTEALNGLVKLVACERNREERWSHESPLMLFPRFLKVGGS